MAEMNSDFLGTKPPKQELDQLRTIFEKKLISVGHKEWLKADSLHSSDRSVNNLSRIAISDLTVHVPAKGSYLLLRTISHPRLARCEISIVEDQTGDVFLFAYILLYSKLERNVAHVLPLGTVFILKEPYVTFNDSGDFFLRSDSPSDVIVLTKVHRLFGMTENVKWKNEVVLEPSKDPSSFEDWMRQGNNCYVRKNYSSALYSYLCAAAELQDPSEEKQKVLVYLNISATYSVLKYHEQAQDYALRILGIDPESVGALLEAGRAHYQLREFKKSKEYFEDAVSIQPDHPEGTTELKKTEKRLEERSRGASVAELYDTSKSNPRTLIDCADFVGPIKIVKSSGKRRKVQATQDIRPGTLLAVSRALICVFNESTPVFKDSYEQLVTTSEFGEAVQKTSELIYKNPKTFGSAIYSLPVNSELANSDIPKPFCEKNSDEPYVDIARIRNVLFRNGVSINSKFKSIGLVSNSCALFHFPSFINHSCLPNASWTTYNNVMVVHAIKHIKAGEEVTLSYFDPLTIYSRKRREFYKRDVSCNCSFCESLLDFPEPLMNDIENRLLEMRNFLEETQKNKSSTARVILEMEEAVEILEGLVQNANSSGVSYYLTSAYHCLALTYSQAGRNEEAIHTLRQAISTLRFDSRIINAWSSSQSDIPLPKDSLFSETILYCIELLHKCNKALRKEVEANKCLSALEVGHQILRGATKQMLVETTFKQQIIFV